MGNLRESPEPSGEEATGSPSRDPSGSHGRGRLPVHLARMSSTVAGLLEVPSPSGRTGYFQVLGWVVVATMSLTLAQMASVKRMAESTIVNS